jgi:hypothetical protein
MVGIWMRPRRWACHPWPWARRVRQPPWGHDSVCPAGRWRSRRCRSGPLHGRSGQCWCRPLGQNREVPNHVCSRCSIIFQFMYSCTRSYLVIAWFVFLQILNLVPTHVCGEDERRTQAFAHGGHQSNDKVFTTTEIIFSDAALFYQRQFN